MCPLSVALSRPAFAAPLILHARYLHTTVPVLHPTLTVRHFAPKTKYIKRPRAVVAPPGSPIPHRIAIVGGGLAGLAVAYHLLYSTARWARKRSFDHTSIQISILDPHPPGIAGGSAAAAGLLHDFRPRPKTKAWQGTKALNAALHLLDVVDQPVHVTTGLLRLSRGSRDDEDFSISAGRFPKEVELLTQEDLRDRFPFVSTSSDALLIREAHVVDTPNYLRALWRTCQATGRVSWHHHAVTDVSTLLTNPIPNPSASSPISFDTVVLCAGAAVASLSGLSRIPITPSFGTNLLLQGPHTPPNVPLIANTYLIPDAFSPPQVNAPARLIAGSTREFLDAPPSAPSPALQTDIDATVSTRLRDGLHTLHPDLLDNWQVVGALSGTRALPARTKNGSLPVVCRVDGAPDGKSCWLFTGLGARGLLYHAYLGRTLAHAIVSGLDRHIPEEARRSGISLSGLEPRQNVEEKTDAVDDEHATP